MSSRLVSQKDKWRFLYNMNIAPKFKNKLHSFMINLASLPVQNKMTKIVGTDSCCQTLKGTIWETEHRSAFSSKNRTSTRFRP